MGNLDTNLGALHIFYNGICSSKNNSFKDVIDPMAIMITVYQIVDHI